MKTRFSTIDIRASISEINQRLIGMRVANIYDIDNRTYLIKLAMPDNKQMLLIESGNRIHSTEFDWPKGMMPSGFSMKLRKHLRTRRLEKITQLGIDRIIDLQFGSGEASYHIIVELYDRGNIVLTDHEYIILNLLRARNDDSQDVRIAVREKYPIELARQPEGCIEQEKLIAILMSAKEGDQIRKILNPHLVYGPAVIEHCLIGAGISPNSRLGKEFIINNDIQKLLAALKEAEDVLHAMDRGCNKGYIIQKREARPAVEAGENPEYLTYQEFHPMLYRQHENSSHFEMPTFNKAIDEFFSKIESQKVDTKVLQAERSALKKLENVKKDHEKRLVALQSEQDIDKKKGQLIELNLSLVNQAITVVRSALANQIDWVDIQNLVQEAQIAKDPVASCIKSLQLETNHITLFLKDPYDRESDDDGEDNDSLIPMKVSIDLSLSAHANARKYFDMKKNAAVKEQKTMDASGKALKSAEKKTKQTLKEVQTVATINKARKTYWFEKFLWFITSENYLVIGGRDQQQNELLVKRYLNAGDLYVHADLHGASSCVLKNPTGGDVPPKSLNEAGTMAICNSAAWNAKVVTSAWWVYHYQVSKTAPTGEYLTTGSFMIRGKKNYLPPSYLIYGFGFLFKLDEESIFRHKGERRVRTLDDLESIEEEVDNDNDDDEINHDGKDEKVISDDVTDVIDDNKSEKEESDSEEEKEQCTALKEHTNEELEVLSDDKDLPKSESLHDTDVCPKTLEAVDQDIFPDTSISLHHVKGDKYAVQVHHNADARKDSISFEDEPIFLGDNQPIMMGKKDSSSGSRGNKLSAKQKRELKRKNKNTSIQSEEGQTIGTCTNVEVKMDIVQNQTQNNQKKKSQQDSEASSSECNQHLKRGQKAKLKKMKEKYKDQDEEERQLRLEILASAGLPKEDKKKAKKNKKKQQNQSGQAQKDTSQSKPTPAVKTEKSIGKLTVDDIKVETLTVGDYPDENSDYPKEKAENGDDSDDEKQAILEDENIQITSDADILDSLTGAPVGEDLLLFAVPVCAPYQALTNYKYKVKLLPGGTKRGKATKTAVTIFQQDRNVTPREKDLFKSLKDQDLARLLPGKVKLSAPNLQKAKRK